MASLVNAVLCAAVATAFWSLLGYAVARHLLPRVLALGVAPVLGWAVHSAATLPLLELTGFSRTAVIGIGIVCIFLSVGSLLAPAAKRDVAAAPREAAPEITPTWLCAAAAAAAILALGPAAAIMPKFAAGAVHFADPIFDHSKIAIVDAMTRQGLPPVNPIFGPFGAPGRLAYYYLWHFSAAQLALPLGTSGWEADIGLTWFTAFTSLALMMALATWFGRDPRAAFIVVVLAASSSIRPTLGELFGVPELQPFLATPTGFSGWLFQSAWAPQHVMSASCVVAAMLLVVRYCHRSSAALLPALVLLAAAAFESSTYVGGVTFAIAAVGAAPILLARIEPARRLRFAAGMAVAVVLVAILAAPFLVSQLATVAARHDSSPVVFRHFPVLGAMFPHWLRQILDFPAFWLIEMPLEFPATYLAGVIALFLMLRSPSSRQQQTQLAAFVCLAGAGLGASWLLASTLGDLNDLAMRAVLPTAIIFIVATGAAMVRSTRRGLIAATALCGMALSVPHSAELIRSNFAGHTHRDDRVFAHSPELWAAVRRYAGPADRVANNPLFLQDLTPWPANMSWALLANRSSCFAGRELAIAFAPLPAALREAVNDQFIRVFDGEGTTEDVDDMAGRYGCSVVVVTVQDRAWDKDIFAASTDYRLADSRPGQWRIYVKAAVARR